ncbi:MAG: PLP-dependent aminotransferase family protein [Actinobacteria bacterium]|nr:PLP-dependent aminotransferase family protein [Actinomycetota bacterium]
MSTSPIVEPIGTSTGPLTADGLLSALGDWTNQGHGGLSRRLAQSLRSAITGGLLRSGTRLPPERRMAELLAVSRSTVTAALDELRADGLVTSRQGRGTEVVGAAGEGPVGHRVGSNFLPRSGVDLAAVVPTDGRHLPPLVVRTEDIVAAQGHLEPSGLPALREVLAERAGRLSRPTDPSEIEVTHGTHHSIALTMDAFVDPGATVLVEDPSYPGLLDTLDHRRARAVPIPGDRGGPDPDALRRLLRRHRPAVVYLQTGPQNPTGRLIAPARRRTIADVLDEHGDAILFEDEALADLAFGGRAGPSFASLCRHAPVISAESCTKVAWATLRIGWIRATGVTRERLARVRIATDLGASMPAQLIALQLVPELEQLAERRRNELEVAVDRAIDHLHEVLPDWTVERPTGSSALWPELPLADAAPFVALARRHGVHVSPGSAHRVDGGPDPHLRICVDRPAAHVAEGLDRLAAAWHDLRTRAIT